MDTTDIDTDPDALWRLDVDALLSAATGSAREARLRYAHDLRVIAELDAKGAAGVKGYATLGALVAATWRIGTDDAHQRILHAQALHPVVMPSGAVIPAPLPVLAAAVTRGEYTAKQVQAIVTGLQHLPATLSPEGRVAVETEVVDRARDLSPRVITRLIQKVIAFWDQDGPAPTEPPTSVLTNELHTVTGPDGRMRGRFDLDPETSAALEAMLSPLAAPQSSKDTGPDLRTHAQRQGDALAEIIHRTLRTAELPDEAGERPHITVTISWEQLRTNVGTATMGDNQPLNAAEARKLACDSAIIPAVLGTTSEILDIGWKTRTIPTALRRALILRDKGCCFPGVRHEALSTYSEVRDRRRCYVAS